MAYKHRVHSLEQASSLLSIAAVDAGIPFVVGTAPVNMSNLAVNKPVLVQNYTEAFAAFGYVPPKLDEESGLKKFEYTISEFMRSQFQLFGYGPAVIVNVLDPSKHVSDIETTSITLDTKKGSCTIEETGILLNELVVGEYKADEDYTAAFDDDGNVVITSSVDEEGEFLMPVGEEISISGEKLDPSKVTPDDIIGGVTTTDEGEIVETGLELIESVYPLFRVLPGLVIAPGYTTSAVAAVMSSKCESVNEIFRCISVVDIPTDEVKDYSNAAAWKTNHNITDPRTVVCWPMIALDKELFHMSTQLVALMDKVDAEAGDVPYESPSNKNLNMDQMVLEDGTEIVMKLPNAEYLNGEGIVTALNFSNGFVAFGNRTACYPGNTDPKDAFIPLKRMFAWVSNTSILTCWQRLDKPLNRRQIDTIVDSLQQWLNGLVAQEKLIYGKVSFEEEDNTITDLADGIANFRFVITPPSPNREICFLISYDASALSALFS